MAKQRFISIVFVLALSLLNAQALNDLLDDTDRLLTPHMLGLTRAGGDLSGGNLKQDVHHYDQTKAIGP